MFRARFSACFLGFVLMLAAASTEAREARLLVDSNVGWESNVVQQVDGSKSDGYWEFSPRLSVRDSRETLEYDFSYRPTHQAFFRTPGIDGWDHLGRADLEWRPTPADQFSFGGSVNSTRIVRQFRDLVPAITPLDPDQFIIIETDRRRIVRSRARAGYRRSLNAATAAQIDLLFEDLDFSDEQNVDIRTYSASIGGDQVINALTRIGLSATGRMRVGRGLDLPFPRGQFSSQTLTGDFSVFVFRSLTPSLDFSARVGPSFTRTELNAPPARDADPLTPVRDRTSSDRSISFVADVNLAKRWRHSAASIGYTRFESGTGGSSSASIVDQISLSINKRPTRRWNLNWNASWNQRKTISAIGAAGARKFQRYSTSGSAAYAVTRQVSIIARASYRYIGNRLRSPGQTRTVVTEIFVAAITLRYEFDPILF